MKPRRQTVEGEGYLHARLVFFIFSQPNSIKRTILLSFKKFKSFYERQRYYPQEKQCQVFTIHNLSPKATFPYIAGIETRTWKEQLKWLHEQNSRSDEGNRRLHAYKQFPQLDTHTRGSLLPIPYVQSHCSKKHHVPCHNTASSHKCYCNAGITSTLSHKTKGIGWASLNSNLIMGRKEGFYFKWQDAFVE